MDSTDRMISIVLGVLERNDIPIPPAPSVRTAETDGQYLDQLLTLAEKRLVIDAVDRAFPSS